MFFHDTQLSAMEVHENWCIVNVWIHVERVIMEWCVNITVDIKMKKFRIFSLYIIYLYYMLGYSRLILYFDPHIFVFLFASSQPRPKLHLLLTNSPLPEVFINPWNWAFLIRSEGCGTQLGLAKLPMVSWYMQFVITVHTWKSLAQFFKSHQSTMYVLWWYMQWTSVYVRDSVVCER